MRKKNGIEQTTTYKTAMTNRPTVYITRQIPMKGLDLLLGRCNVSYWDSPDPAPRTELLMNVRGVEVLMCMPTDKIDLEIFNAAGPSLKIVATMSEDADHIDKAECDRRNIQIVCIKKVSMETVVDLLLGSFVMSTGTWLDEKTGNLNKVLQAKDITEAVKEDQKYCVELSNRVLGIIGLGKLGLAVAKRFKDLGVASIWYHDKCEVAMAEVTGAKYVTMDQLLKSSDIVCVCSNIQTSSTVKTTLNKKAFKQMKSSAILIDATKGLAAEFTELYEALRNGEISAAGLDVREYGVIPNRHPLTALENCYFLPYRECYKWDGRRSLSAELAKSILECL